MKLSHAMFLMLACTNINTLASSSSNKVSMGQAIAIMRRQRNLPRRGDDSPSPRCRAAAEAAGLADYAANPAEFDFDQDELVCSPTRRASASSRISVTTQASSSSSASALTSSLAVAEDITQADVAQVMEDKRWRREMEEVALRYKKVRAKIALATLQADPGATVENVKDGVEELIKKKIYSDSVTRAQALRVHANKNFLNKVIYRDLKTELFQDQRAFEIYNSKNPQVKLKEYIETQGCITQ